MPPRRRTRRCSRRPPACRSPGLQAHPGGGRFGCRIEYRGDGPGRVCWSYTGIEGERTWARQYNSWPEAAVALVRDDWRFFGGEIDGVPIDQGA